MNDDESQWRSNLFQTSSRGKLPPLVTTKCKLQDDGRLNERMHNFLCNLHQVVCHSGARPKKQYYYSFAFMVYDLFCIHTV